MRLDAYLQRIGFAGEPRPDADTLRRLHRGHIENIPYDNLDVQLGNRVGFDLPAIFDKLVTRRRGGWCYEQNGLMGWALAEIGFEVTRLSGAVGRIERGPSSHGNHLILRVDLDRPYLCDAGFGDGLIEAAPIAPSTFEQDGFKMGFSETEDGWLRFHSPSSGLTATFDFTHDAADEGRFQERCHWLQTSPESGFVQTLVVQGYRKGRHACLRGKVLQLSQPGRMDQAVLYSPADLVRTLRNEFGIDAPEAAGLWDRIEAQHKRVFGSSGMS